MDLSAEQAGADRPGQAWLDSLPAAAAKNAAAALAALPTDAVSAGAELPLAIAAWSLAEPEVAARLLEAWLAAADGEGNLSPACPVVCQWTERVADALPDPETFMARILPGLAKCVVREFDRHDPRGTGLPLWPAAEEALFPAEFAPERFTVDLAVLLSNEAASFCRLARGHPELDSALGAAEGEQRELDDWLLENFWDEESAAFHRHDPGAESVPDFSPCGLFPLAWEGRTEAMVEGLRPRLAQGDLSAWPARAHVLFFALLLHTPHNSALARMRKAGLPAHVSAVEQAAWTVLAAGADGVRAQFLDDIPRAARWLDAHGHSLARGLVAGGLALALVLLGWWVSQRGKPGADDVAALERRAGLACAEGRHDRAAALYGQAARRGSPVYFRYRQAGEWMHLGQFTAAEEAYRRILARAPDTPNARMNLALSVLRQGRREEALALYRALAEEAGAAAHPELAARARLAAELIQRQLALDRAAGGE